MACTAYYTDNDDITKITCSTSCDSATQFKSIPTGTCIAKTAGCEEGYILSSDKTSCDSQCNYPDIKRDAACVTEASCTGENLIIDET